jgi:hypothetical protein
LLVASTLTPQELTSGTVERVTEGRREEILAGCIANERRCRCGERSGEPSRLRRAMTEDQLFTRWTAADLRAAATRALAECCDDRRRVLRDCIGEECD